MTVVPFIRSKPESVGFLTEKVGYSNSQVKLSEYIAGTLQGIGNAGSSLKCVRIAMSRIGVSTGAIADDADCRCSWPFVWATLLVNLNICPERQSPGLRQEPNVERLATLAPDLILASDQQVDLQPVLERIAPVRSMPR